MLCYRDRAPDKTILAHTTWPEGGLFLIQDEPEGVVHQAGNVGWSRSGRLWTEVVKSNPRLGIPMKHTGV